MLSIECCRSSPAACIVLATSIFLAASIALADIRIHFVCLECTSYLSLEGKRNFQAPPTIHCDGRNDKNRCSKECDASRSSNRIDLIVFMYRMNYRYQGDCSEQFIGRPTGRPTGRPSLSDRPCLIALVREKQAPKPFHWIHIIRISSLELEFTL